MSKRNGVLLSWVAYNNDPYEREGQSEEFKVDADGNRIPGPTLTFLFDEGSPYKDKVGDVVLFSRHDGKSDSRVIETFREIREQDGSINHRRKIWKGKDPTDHEGIFAFLREELAKLRDEYAGRDLYLHVSPGTPSMHTIWVLMATTGFVEQPFHLLKSLRKHERYGRPAVVPVELRIDTFYQRFQESRPAETSSSDETLKWEPSNFKSRALIDLYAQVDRITKLRVPILILGERGTGKTTLASYIRSRSDFAKKELNDGWPAVACGQYQGETIRSELFGHAKGAFTGAHADKEGLLERADGDTLFLDEIGDLSKETQRTLIKAIEEHRFQPVGSQEWKKSRFRLITATNVPLAELRERLDPDFFDRIALIRVTTPPLREIQEDLPWLWRKMFGKAVREADSGLQLPEEHHDVVVSYLRAQPLGGNLRDLHAVAWRLLARWGEEWPPSEGDLKRWLPSALDPLTRRASDDIAREVGARFAEGAPLDDLVSTDSPLRPKAVRSTFQRYMAEELRRISTSRGLKVDDIANGVTGKTLRDWVKSKE